MDQKFVQLVAFGMGTVTLIISIVLIMKFVAMANDIKALRTIVTKYINYKVAMDNKQNASNSQNTTTQTEK